MWVLKALEISALVVTGNGCDSWLDIIVNSNLVFLPFRIILPPSMQPQRSPHAETFSRPLISALLTEFLNAFFFVFLLLKEERRCLGRGRDLPLGRGMMPAE